MAKIVIIGLFQSADSQDLEYQGFLTNLLKNCSKTVSPVSILMNKVKKKQRPNCYDPPPHQPLMSLFWMLLGLLGLTT